MHYAAIVASLRSLGCRSERVGGVGFKFVTPQVTSFDLSRNLKFSANPLREHVKFLSRHTRWVAGSCALLAYRFLQDGFYVGFLRN